jgi:hypothetical protein
MTAKQTKRQQPLLGSNQRDTGLAGKGCRAVYTTEERCFLCGPCLDVVSRTIGRFSAVKLSAVQESKELVVELVN